MTSNTVLSFQFSVLSPTKFCLLLAAFLCFAKNHHEIPSSILRGPPRRGDAVDVFDAWIGAPFEQHAHGGALSIRRRPHQGRPTKFVLHVWIRAGIEQQAENCRITEPCCTVH